MPSDLQSIVREQLAAVIDDTPATEIDLDASMADDYGLTSLNKVLFLTSVCDQAGVELSHFTEHDVASMTTARDVVEAMSAHADHSEANA
jgi:acyl carrier protein